MRCFRLHRPFFYVAGGLFLGVAYAFLNTQVDAWANAGAIGQTFAAFHAFVDRGIPLLAGGLLGLAFHWLHLRARLAQAESLRSEELRTRLTHVERNQAVWVVAASTLHELKNPLHTMGLLVDELEHVARGGDLDAITDHVQLVRKQMDRTVGPLDALRSLTRQGPRTPKLSPLGPTVEAIVESLRPLASEAGVDVRIEGQRRATIEVDAELLRIVVDNLVVNALEGGDGKRRARHVVLHIDDHPESDRVVLRVSDDGPGLPEARRESLFEPLHTDKSTGLGLGLPIARALSRALGGELTATEAAGYSTVFELVLPARRGVQ